MAQLSLTNVLLGLLVGIVAFIGRRIIERLDKLEVCVRDFAKQTDNQNEHNKIWEKLDKHDSRITRLETSHRL